jgi:site-specific DNA-methyltransferase (adenine-specific)
VEPYYRSPSGDVVLYQGDCEAVLPTLRAGSVDLVFTSPPYNLGNTTGGGVHGLGHYAASAKMGRRGGARVRRWVKPAIADGYGVHDDDMPHGEYVAWQHRVLRLLWPLLSPTGAIFYNHKPRILGGRLLPAMSYVPPELLPQVRQEIIWARAGGMNFTEAFYCNTHERIIVVARDGWRLTGKAASGLGDVWYVPQARGNPHPAPFPIGLPARAIETCAPATVLDPFAGSGTTIRAAKDAGVRAIGIELSERWCRHVIERLSQSVLPGWSGTAAGGCGDAAQTR